MDAILDELAAAAVGSPGRRAIPADPIARPETPQEPGTGWETRHWRRP
jgi:hypothetical protein